MTTDPPPDRRPHPAAWAVPVLANLVMGVPAVVPFLLLVLFFRNFPLVWIGIGSRDPNEDDGPLPWVAGLVIVLGALLLLWWPVNLLIRRLLRLRVRGYWRSSAALLLVPSAVLAALPDGALGALVSRL
ncbi:hypothetical protein ACIRBX_28750 [Kitasatospora sp. NPDC096147]|uniref:hypothetical protein n=1 Tax=Kitasatospora sp. NPDC096147 TaxID=3364093 RepID=UPI00381CB389